MMHGTKSPYQQLQNKWLIKLNLEQMVGEP
jgi:hypothetical protein